MSAYSSSVAQKITESARVPDVYIAAGSNVEPEKNLRLALRLLDEKFAPLKVSSAYKNKAVGFEGEDFINLVIGFTTELSMQGVLEALHSIETACGRPRNAPKWAPRSMDLDVLLYGDRIEKTEAYTLPRPDLIRRPYMLGPMAEIAPDVRHPLGDKTFAQLWNEFDRDAHSMQSVQL
jgi:2-amino-4-hydroxy-6-hydroxymethyldihydropteridine diphosphokinase